MKPFHWGTPLGNTKITKSSKIPERSWVLQSVSSSSTRHTFHSKMGSNVHPVERSLAMRSVQFRNQYNTFVTRMSTRKRHFLNANSKISTSTITIQSRHYKQRTSSPECTEVASMSYVQAERELRLGICRPADFLPWYCFLDSCVHEYIESVQSRKEALGGADLARFVEQLQEPVGLPPIRKAGLLELFCAELELRYGRRNPLEMVNLEPRICPEQALLFQTPGVDHLVMARDCSVRC
mmetsp:Transcript_3947/g.6941  ORF Transcript_3947/g.6941 Transcript_3947/m.6941 type:complete len:238 (+) Transcript_3947:484-1197(+)